MCVGSPTLGELTISKFVLVGFSSVVAFLFLLCGLISCAAVRSPLHAVVMAPTPEEFFEMDAWPRSFVVIVFLVVREKWDDLSSRGMLSTGLCPHGTNKFRCGPSSATETVMITSRPLDGSNQGCEGLAMRRSRSNTAEVQAGEVDSLRAGPYAGYDGKRSIELTARLFFGDHLSCGR